MEKPDHPENKYFPQSWQKRCNKAFTNRTAITSSASKIQFDLLERNGLCKRLVIMRLMEVNAKAGQKIGTLLDLTSDTNYSTHKTADKLRLQSEKIQKLFPEVKLKELERPKDVGLLIRHREQRLDPQRVKVVGENVIT